MHWAENTTIHPETEEDVMKTIAALIMTVLTISTVYAGEQRERGYFAETARYANVDANQAARGYISSLKSENEGVMESALAHVAMLRLAAPATESNALRVKVREIARKSSSNELRYKAYLVAKVIEYPEIFRGIELQEHGSADALFAAIANRLNGFYAAR